MKIIDCTTYFEEKTMMEIRFNILDKYVDNFIVCEANFTHSGLKKEICFNANNYPEFKKKIIHLVMKSDPCIENQSFSKLSEREKSIIRIAEQRNFIKKALVDFSKEDFILHSDNDEIPNLTNINFNELQKKIIIFQQDLFYYKLNLIYPEFFWYGTKGSTLKNLKSFDWLRNIKNKKYSIFRIDTYLSKIKYSNIEIIKNGGWHFSNLKTIDELIRKYLNDENFSEFKEKKIEINQIKDYIKRRVIPHNHFVDKKSSKKSEEILLKKIDDDRLPLFLKMNKDKYNSWFAK